MSELSIPINKTVTEDKDISDQLMSRLERADQIEKSMEELVAKLQKSEESNAEKHREIRALEALKLRSEELDTREREVVAREQAVSAEERLNDLRIEHEKQRVEDHKAMVSLIFRNTELRKSKLTPVALSTGETVYYDGTGNPIGIDSGEIIQSCESTEVVSEE